MKQIINPAHQKFYVVLIAALGGFFGLQAASQALAANQVNQFISISFYVYLFLVVWQTFIFDLHLKKVGPWQALRERFAYLAQKHHWLHFQNYLILPGVIYWMTVILVYLNPFEQRLKQVFIALSTLGLAIGYWYLKTVFYRHHEARGLTRQLIFLAKLYASYLGYTAALGIARYFGPYQPDVTAYTYFPLGAPWLAILVFAVTFLLLYQALFQHHFVGFKMLKFLLAVAFALGALSLVIYQFWSANFYTGALLMAAIYNTVWGLIHHQYLDNNLTRKTVFEYLAVLFVVLVIVFGVTNFAERI